MPNITTNHAITYTNTLVSRVMPESIILNFFSINRQTLEWNTERQKINLRAKVGENPYLVSEAVYWSFGRMNISFD